MASIWISCTRVPTNVDVSWLMVAAGRLLDGAQLHTDIVELNPPFSIWLYTPFVLAERMIGLRAELWVSIGMAALALLSLWLSVCILGGAKQFKRNLMWLAPASTFVALYPFPYDFAQREHIAALSLLPWLALQAARTQSDDFEAGTTAQRILAGLGAAVFLMVKPPWSAIPIGILLLYLVVLRRSPRPLFTPETLLAGTISLVYVLWFLIFQAAFFTELFGTLQDVYFPRRLPVLESAMTWQARLLAVLAFAAWLAARPRPMSGIARFLMAAAIAYVPVYFIMGRGWTYHALPCLIFGALGFLVQLAAMPREAGQRALRFAGAAVGILALAVTLIGEQVGALTNGRETLDRKIAAVDAIVRRPTIGTLATRLQEAHPLTREIAGSYVSAVPGLWMVENAAVLLGDVPENAASLRAVQDRYIGEAVAELGRARPDIITAGGTRPTPGQDRIDRDPAVAALLSGYEPIYRDPATTIFARRDLVGAGTSSPED